MTEAERELADLRLRHEAQHRELVNTSIRVEELREVNLQHVGRITEAYAALGIELHDGDLVRSLADHIAILQEQIGECEQAAQCWGNVMAGCDIERNGKLYRQVEVVKGSGRIRAELEREWYKTKVEHLSAQNRALQLEVDAIHAVREIPIKLTWEEMAARYRKDLLRSEARVKGLLIQVKRWAQKAKDLGAINRRGARAKGAKS